MEVLLEPAGTRDMYRKILKPSSRNNTISFPRSLYGREVEVIVFPVTPPVVLSENPVQERRKKREENTRKYAVSFSKLGYQFNREEANNYDE
jgi:hypothetical protein